MFRTSVRMTEVDLNVELAPNRHTSFFFRVNSVNHTVTSHPSHDVLVVDRSLTANPQDIVVAHNDEEFFIMRYPLPEGYELWGPVTYRIQKLKEVKTLQEIKEEKEKTIKEVKQ